METAILRSVMSKEGSTRKGYTRNTGSGIQLSGRRSTHAKYLNRRHEQAVVSSQTIKARNHKTPTGAQGEIKIGLCYFPKDERLRVDIIESRNLIENHTFHSPLCNCSATHTYVKIWMVQFGSCVAAQASRTAKQSESPPYRKQFCFPLQFNKAGSTQLVIAVCNGSPMVTNDEIGHVILGKGRDKLERTHWEAAFKNMNEPTEMWHKLTNEWC
ncbi:C2 domain protein [Trichuris suis]|nr:C2 domain protein [Trichuris suis]